MVMAFVNRNTKELLVSLSYADEKDIEFSGNCLNVEYDAVKLTDEEFKNSVVEKGGKKYLVRGCYSKKITVCVVVKETKELIATFEVNACSWGQNENFCANVSLSHGYDIITSDVICNELFITEKDGKRYLNFDKPE